MRYLVGALMCLVLPVASAAQTQQPNAPVSPAPSIGLPLPSIGLPLPPIGLDSSVDQVRSPDNPVRPGRPDHRQRRGTIVIFGAPYNFGIDPALMSATPGVITTSSPTPSPPTSPPAPATGTLRLEVQPSNLAQVFVDGEYVGTADDVAGELELAPGRRQIEIRARGYEPLIFDVRITAGRTITYEGRLERAVPPPPDQKAMPAPAGPPAAGTAATEPVKKGDTFYLIPGCYLGNVPPDQVKLPPGCDLSRLITHKP